MYLSIDDLQSSPRTYYIGFCRWILDMFVALHASTQPSSRVPSFAVMLQNHRLLIHHEPAYLTPVEILHYPSSFDKSTQRSPPYPLAF
jgi:hypothetical protein